MSVSATSPEQASDALHSSAPPSSERTGMNSKSRSSHRPLIVKRLNQHDKPTPKSLTVLDFPPEITLDILSLCASSDPPTRESPGWIVVTHVCQYWRKIAVAAMAKYWAGVVPALGPALVDALAARARNHPLTFTIPAPLVEDDLYEEGRDIGAVDDYHSCAFRAAMTYVERLGSLSDETFSVATLVQALAGATCPSLRVLTLKQRAGVPWEESLSPLNAPALEQVDYKSTFLPVVAPCLTFLSIGGYLPTSFTLFALFQLLRGSPGLEEVKIDIPAEREFSGDLGDAVELPKLLCLRVRSGFATVERIYSHMVVPRTAIEDIVVRSGELSSPMEPERRKRLCKIALGYGHHNGLGISTSVNQGRGDACWYSLMFSTYPSRDDFDPTLQRVKLVFADMNRSEVCEVVRDVAQATSCRELDVSGLPSYLCNDLGEGPLDFPSATSLVINLIHARVLYTLQCDRPAPLFPYVRRLGVRLTNTSGPMAIRDVDHRQAMWNSLVRALVHLKHADEKSGIVDLHVFEDPRHAASPRSESHDSDDQSGLRDASVLVERIIDDRPELVKNNHLAPGKAICTVASRQVQEWGKAFNPDDVEGELDSEIDESDCGESMAEERRRLEETVEADLEQRLSFFPTWDEDTPSDEALRRVQEPTDEEFWAVSDDDTSEEDVGGVLEVQDLWQWSDDSDDEDESDEESEVDDTDAA